MKKHWEKIYSKKADNEVSWFQATPETSLLLVKKYAKSKSDHIIDIGGGNSSLVNNLAENCYTNLSILDVSKVALDRNKSKNKTNIKIDYIETNMLNFKNDKKYDIWHDRAAFHFLTDKADVDLYSQVAFNQMNNNGFLIFSTFSLSGPDKCSGLDISKYGKNEICNVFMDGFELIECFEEVHKTPFNSTQDFIWTVFQKS
ncbi:class I SAM-dependent methyltransferase [Bacteroidota bacterium]